MEPEIITKRMVGECSSSVTDSNVTLFTECQSEIIQLHPDSTFCDISRHALL